MRHDTLNLEVFRMNVPFSLSIGAFSFVSVPLFIAGLISTYYLIRFKDKTPATWYLVGGLGGLTLSMLAWFRSIHSRARHVKGKLR